MKLKSWFTYFAMVTAGFAVTSMCTDHHTLQKFVCHLVGNTACIFAGIYLANEIKEQEKQNNYGNNYRRIRFF